MTKRISRILSVQLLFFLLLSGCAKDSAYQAEDDWEDEVLRAQDCGMDGLQCCLNKDEPCFYGQICCIDPKNSKRNYCADDCVLGKLDSFCRVSEDECDSGLSCLNGKCVVCGNENEPCCSSGNSCNNDLICYSNQCLQCGLAGHPCCVNEPACFDQEKDDASRTECRNKACVFCGSGGGIACQSKPYCLSRHLLSNGNCYKCGGFNQPCCATSTENDFVCDTNLELECELGFCSKKFE